MATAVSSPLAFRSRSGIRQCFAAAVVISNIIVCLLTSPTTALPMKDAVGQAMKRDGQQQQQQQQQQQPQYHREKREDDCAHPTDVQLFDLFVLSNPMVNRYFLDIIAKKEVSQESNTCLTTWGTDLSSLADRCPCPRFLRTYQLPNGSYPTSLSWAHCMSPKCLKMNAYGCQSVKATINFLKASGCQNGTMAYQRVPYVVSVDCACADGKSLTTTTISYPVSTTDRWWAD